MRPAILVLAIAGCASAPDPAVDYWKCLERTHSYVQCDKMTTGSKIRDFFEVRVYHNKVWWEADRDIEPIPYDMLRGQFLDVGPNWHGERLPPPTLFVPEEEFEITPEQWWDGRIG